MRSVCLDCGPLEAPTAATIDQLARLQLTARRCGCELELLNANPYLLELIGFVGLAEGLRVEARRQAEQRKEPGGVEEEGELCDPSIRKFEHLQSPRLIAPVRARLVLAEGGRAVRADDGNHARAAAAVSRSEPPCQAGGATAPPHVAGRQDPQSVV